MPSNRGKVLTGTQDGSDGHGLVGFLMPRMAPLAGARAGIEAGPEESSCTVIHQLEGEPQPISLLVELTVQEPESAFWRQCLRAAVWARALLSSSTSSQSPFDRKVLTIRSRNLVADMGTSRTLTSPMAMVW